MPARRKAHHAHPVRIISLARRQRPNQPQGALGILQRRLRACRPTVSGQAIEQRETGIARRRQPPRHIIALMADGDPAVTAAGDQQYRRAIWLCGPQQRQGRRHDMGKDAIVRSAIGPAQRLHLLHGHLLAARRLARPDRKALEPLGQREGAGLDRLAQRRPGHRRARYGAGQQGAAIDRSHRRWVPLRLACRPYCRFTYMPPSTSSAAPVI